MAYGRGSPALGPRAGSAQAGATWGERARGEVVAAGLARWAWVVVPAGFLGLFVVWPLVAVLARSFRDVGLDRFVDVATRSSTRSVLVFTLVQAAVSTGLTMLIGLPVAQVLARYQFWGKRALRALVVVPFVLPTVVVASAFVALFQRSPVGSSRSLGAILAAHVFFNVAVVVRIVGGFWSTSDRRLEESARVLGANQWQTFRLVSLPRLAPVLAASGVLVFLFSFTSFGVIRVLGGPARATIETEIYRYAVRRTEFDVAGVLALIQVGVVSVLAGMSGRFQRRVTRVQRGSRRPLSVPVRGWGARLHLFGGLGLVVVVIVVPLMVLVEGSLAVDDGYGFDHYRRLFESGDLLPVSAMRAVVNSLVFAVMAALVAMAVGVSAAVAVVGGGRVGRWLEALTLVPLGVSAVTLGFGYLLAFTVFDFRRSIWLVPLAHAVIGLPFVLASVVPALRSIDPRMREAAASLGATRLAVRRTIEWPLVRAAVVTGGGFAAAVSIGEFGATSFLARGDASFTAPLAVFRLVSQPGAVLRGQALALSVVVGLLVGVIAVAIEWRRGDGVTLL
ncbi:MAG: iron ABC transporter permease [Actinomycetia bacterium]|nr:iron ABC transporter permease [Actinomycetes bacterium]